MPACLQAQSAAGAAPSGVADYVNLCDPPGPRRAQIPQRVKQELDESDSEVQDQLQQLHLQHQQQQVERCDDVCPRICCMAEQIGL